MYWDTSALLKLYVPEPDSAFFLDLAATGTDQILSSGIAAVEVLCALHRKEAGGDLKPGGARSLFRRFAADAAAGRIVTVPYGRDVLSQAEKLLDLLRSRRRAPVIRGLDAIHLASALVSKASTLVATDRRLRETAAVLGMRLLPDLT